MSSWKASFTFNLNCSLLC
uniref:Uncharacterized protein n=1 Tax=Arundo donax TaxID=35708 RepID=A0A0A9AQW0_ARUDO